MRIKVQHVKVLAVLLIIVALFLTGIIKVSCWLDSAVPPKTEFVERNNKVVPYCVICGYKNIQYEDLDEAFNSFVGTVKCPECGAIGTISVEWIGKKDHD